MLRELFNYIFPSFPEGYEQDWSLSRKLDKQNKVDYDAHVDFLEDLKTLMHLSAGEPILKDAEDAWTNGVHSENMEQHRRISKIQNGPEIE